MPAPRKKKGARGRPNPQANTSQSGVLSLGGLWCFRFLTGLGVPIVLLGILEVILRLAGFGYPTSFLLTSQRDGRPVFVQNNCFGEALDQFNQVLQRNPNHAAALQYVKAINRKLSLMQSGKNN